jgi:hypothetical protein
MPKSKFSKIEKIQKEKPKNSKIEDIEKCKN